MFCKRTGEPFLKHKSNNAVFKVCCKGSSFGLKTRIVKPGQTFPLGTSMEKGVVAKMKNEGYPFGWGRLSTT